MGSKIRILHYVSGFAETAGGIESFLYNVFEAFQNQTDVEMLLLTRYCYKNSEFYKKYSVAGFKVVSLDIQHLGLSEFFEFKNKLDIFLEKNKFDILHLHGTDEPLVISSAKKHGVKRILIHSHTPDMEMNGRRLWMKYIKLLWRSNNIKSADYYAGCSTDVLSTIFTDIEKNKKFLINNCIDTIKYKYNSALSDNLRDQLMITDKDCVIGHVGRFVDTKNQTFILKVLRCAKHHAANWKLILIGNGHDYERIIKEAQQMNLQEDVIFLGERNDVAEMMSVFDKFIFPSKFEGLGMTIIEAQASGLPCVISDVIPKEVIVTELVQSLSLDLGEEYWFNILNDLPLNNNREDYAEKVSSAGYGLSILYESLMNIYRRILNDR